jgi:hypothetical protein
MAELGGTAQRLTPAMQLAMEFRPSCQGLPKCILVPGVWRGYTKQIPPFPISAMLRNGVPPCMLPCRFSPLLSPSG